MTKEELISFLLVKYEGGDLDASNHSEDNSIYGCRTISEFIKFVEDRKGIYEGLTDKFTFRYYVNKDMALVFKDEADNVFGIHSNKICIYDGIKKILDNDKIKADEVFFKFLKDTDIKGEI